MTLLEFLRKTNQSGEPQRFLQNAFKKKLVPDGSGLYV